MFSFVQRRQKTNVQKSLRRRPYLETLEDRVALAVFSAVNLPSLGTIGNPGLVLTQVYSFGDQTNQFWFGMKASANASAYFGEVGFYRSLDTLDVAIDPEPGDGEDPITVTVDYVYNFQIDGYASVYTTPPPGTLQASAHIRTIPIPSDVDQDVFDPLYITWNKEADGQLLTGNGQISINTLIGQTIHITFQQFDGDVWGGYDDSGYYGEWCEGGVAIDLTLAPPANWSLGRQKHTSLPIPLTTNHEATASSLFQLANASDQLGASNNNLAGVDSVLYLLAQDSKIQRTSSMTIIDGTLHMPAMTDSNPVGQSRLQLTQPADKASLQWTTQKAPANEGFTVEVTGSGQQDQVLFAFRPLNAVAN
jgi:hypothetical protein